MKQNRKFRKNKPKIGSWRDQQRGQTKWTDQKKKEKKLSKMWGERGYNYKLTEIEELLENTMDICVPIN